LGRRKLLPWLFLLPRCLGRGGPAACSSVPCCNPNTNGITSPEAGCRQGLYEPPMHGVVEGMASLSAAKSRTWIHSDQSMYRRIPQPWRYPASFCSDPRAGLFARAPGCGARPPPQCPPPGRLPRPLLVHAGVRALATEHLTAGATRYSLRVDAVSQGCRELISLGGEDAFWGDQPVDAIAYALGEGEIGLRAVARVGGDLQTRDVLDPGRGQRDQRPALLQAERPLRGLLGAPLRSGARPNLGVRSTIICTTPRQASAWCRRAARSVPRKPQRSRARGGAPGRP